MRPAMAAKQLAPICESIGISCRALALQGADIILLPLAGCGPSQYNDVWPARAIENGMYIVASAANPGTPSRITGRNAEILC